MTNDNDTGENLKRFIHESENISLDVVGEEMDILCPLNSEDLAWIRSEIGLEVLND